MIWNIKRVIFMNRHELIIKLEVRKNQLNITLENIAKLSGLGLRTVNRFFAGENVKLNTLEKLTNLLGLDFSGNEELNLSELQEQRAIIKAEFMASLVQTTSALEEQGLDEENLNRLINNFKKQFLDGDYQDRLWVA